MTAPDPLDVLTLPEVAKLLRISPNTVRHHLRDAPWWRVGRRRLIRRQALEAWLATHCDDRPTPQEDPTHEPA